jgi:hypothetical protein
MRSENVPITALSVSDLLRMCTHKASPKAASFSRADPKLESVTVNSDTETINLYNTHIGCPTISIDSARGA